MSRTISIDPLTRIEGHLAIKVQVDGEKVTRAHSSGEMFRGFEVILRGRDPLDAQQITQRICGVCPISHGIASVLAQDEAYGLEIPENGRLARNLILGANYIQSHIIHFYHLSALDFVDIAAISGYYGRDPNLKELKNWVKSEMSSASLYPAAPFLPRYDGQYLSGTQTNIVAIKHYLDALEMRKLAHELGAVFAGKMPHASAIVPGGITERVTAPNIARYISILKKLQDFIDYSYLPDVLGVASAFPEYLKIGKGCGNFISYGAFNEQGSDFFMPPGSISAGKIEDFSEQHINEDTRFSMFSSESGLHPSQSDTVPDPEKSEAYSWLKAPRYKGRPVEVGPLARILVAYRNKHPQARKLVHYALGKLNTDLASLVSVMGRHAARAIECKLVADQCLNWAEQLVPDQPAFKNFRIPDSGYGIGLTEAPRGALGHWMKIENKKVSNYQCVVPTTWNCSPRDDKGVPGPVEQALVGTPVQDSNNPLEAARVVRSFDPCLACAVH